MNGPTHVLLLGATGTAGRATADALVAAGHRLTMIVRPGAMSSGLQTLGEIIEADPLDAAAFSAAIRAAAPEAVVSCLASRTGTPADARAIDRDAHLTALDAARNAGTRHFVLLSALCVQKPLLAFQREKLAFEGKLMASGLTWSIVRPTAFFKSLSGQVRRVMDGKPFLVFGDGRLTACKPISDDDLGTYIAGCLTVPERANAILPIGGPGPAITPLDQVALLRELTGREVPVRRVPVALMSAIIAGLSLAGRVNPKMVERAEYARIGRYYGTESMLVLNPETGRYDADATPETGSKTLRDHYRDLLSGAAAADLGAHAAF